MKEQEASRQKHTHTSPLARLASDYSVTVTEAQQQKPLEIHDSVSKTPLPLAKKNLEN